MELVFINTGTTKGFENYYGNVFIDGKLQGCWTSIPRRNNQPLICFHPEDKKSPLFFTNIDVFRKTIIKKLNIN